MSDSNLSKHISNITELVQDYLKHNLEQKWELSPHFAQTAQILTQLHSADIAQLLESLPLNERMCVWQATTNDRFGDILLEVSDAVKASLLADLEDHEIISAAQNLDADELADLTPELPKDIVNELMQSLDEQQRQRVNSALSYAENQVGSLMDFDMITIRDDVTLEVVLRYIRRLKEIPTQTDKIFVIDKNGNLTGVLPFKLLLLNDPDKKVNEVMATNSIIFKASEDAHEAALAFERYDLVTTPVIDDNGKLIGRLSVDAVLDLVREESETEVLNMAGLREEEDLFAPVWHSVRNRWSWLAINLVTAFIASRVIGLFEDSIEKLVVLATLMPIIAGMGGNSGNQTITMIVRAIALEQIKTGNTSYLMVKELSVALINGIIWGSVIALITWLLYDNFALSVVMIAAMILNLLLAALMGVIIPMMRLFLNKDPALGSSVMITAITDSGGFFIFLSLATIFLL